MTAPSSTAPASPIEEYRRGELLISTDPDKQDVNAIQAFLTQGYFDTVGVEKETVAKAVRSSLCFGIFDGGRQVGFARVITDQVTFAYLCDDYVLESHRGQGLGRWLMECIQAHPQLQGIRRWILGPTHDTRLYEKFGFRPLAGQWMEKLAQRKS